MDYIIPPTDEHDLGRFPNHITFGRETGRDVNFGGIVVDSINSKNSSIADTVYNSGKKKSVGYPIAPQKHLSRHASLPTKRHSASSYSPSIRSQPTIPLPLFNIEKDGDPRISWYMYYEKKGTQREPFLQLRAGYQPTEKYPVRRELHVHDKKSASIKGNDRVHFRNHHNHQESRLLPRAIYFTQRSEERNDRTSIHKLNSMDPIIVNDETTEHTVTGTPQFITSSACAPRSIDALSALSAEDGILSMPNASEMHTMGEEPSSILGNLSVGEQMLFIREKFFYLAKELSNPQQQSQANQLLFIQKQLFLVAEELCVVEQPPATEHLSLIRKQVIRIAEELCPAGLLSYIEGELSISELISRLTGELYSIIEELSLIAKEYSLRGHQLSLGKQLSHISKELSIVVEELSFAAKELQSSGRSDKGQTSLITQNSHHTTFMEQPSWGEPLTSLLLEDDVLQELYTEAFVNIAPDRFKSVFSELLEELAADLLVEAQNEEQQKAIYTIGLQVRDYMDILCTRVYPDVFSANSLTILRDSIPHIEDTKGKMPEKTSNFEVVDDNQEDLLQLKSFIANSEAFQTLRLKLKISVNQAEEAIVSDFNADELPWGNDDFANNPTHYRSGLGDFNPKFDNPTASKDIHHTTYSSTNSEDDTKGFDGFTESPTIPKAISPTLPAELMDDDEDHQEAIFSSFDILLTGVTNATTDVGNEEIASASIPTISIGNDTPGPGIDTNRACVNHQGKSYITTPWRIYTVELAQQSFYHLQWILSRFFISLQLKEPPLLKGKVRIRWNCICGQRLYDDFTELQEGAAQRLEDTLKLNNSSSNSTKIFGNALVNMGNIFSNCFQVILRHSRQKGATLPLHKGQDASVPKSPTDSNWLSAELIYLLLCHKEGFFATKLLQLDLCILKSDKKLFTTLRQKFFSIHGKWRSLISFRTVTNIEFVQFEMYKSELVDVQKKALPLPQNPDYRYKPAPPEVMPPVGENHLMHLFQHPEHAEDEGICLDRFPKKLRERLTICGGGLTGTGWGLHLVEGWNLRKIWITSFLLFGVSSAIWGILWASLGNSIQDAFTVASWMIAFGTLTIGFSETLVGNFD